VNLLEILTLVLFFISFYGLITSRKMIKSVVCSMLMQTAVIVFFLGQGFRSGIRPPIGEYFEALEYVADPLPQALMITAIVIGVAVVTISITMLMSLFRTYKTTDWDVAQRMSME